MKKSVLLFVGLLLTAVSAIAQPAKPQVEFTTWGEGEFYLYNVEAGMFLTNGNAWSQRACFVTGGSNSNIISYDSFIAGQGEFKGVKWDIMAATDSRGLDANNDEFCYTIHNTTDAAFNLAAAAGNSVWADGGPDRAEKEVDGWFLVSQNKSEKTFQLGYIRKNAKKDAEDQVIEGEYEYVVEGGQETPYVLGAYKFDEGDIDTYINESRAYSTWALVDATEYARVEPLFQLYYEGLRLKKLLDDAKELGITADFSAYEATLKKDGVTLEELQEAISKVRPTVEFGKVIAEAKVKDPNRSWAKFETIYADPASTDEIFTANTKLINALLDLKKAIDEGKELDATHSYATAEGLYASDESVLADIEAETQRVNAFVSLKKALDEATEKGCNVAEYVTVYNNVDATKDALAEAEGKVKDLITIADIAAAAASATPDNPADFTTYIVNPSFDVQEDFHGWSSGFGAGGDKSTNAEVFGAQFDVYQDIKNLPGGVYMLACNGYLRLNNNVASDYAAWSSGQISETKMYLQSATQGQYFTPVKFISAGGSSTSLGVAELNTKAIDKNGQEYTLYTPNTMVAADHYFHKSGPDGGASDRYRNEAFGPLTEGDVLRIGVMNDKAQGASWSIFDDFQLFFLGNGADAYKAWANSVATNYNVNFDDNSYYGKAEKEAYESILSTIEASNDPQEISAQILNLNQAAENIVTSKAQYAEYAALLNTAYAWIEENYGTDESYDILDTYLAATDPEDVAEYGFPNGPAQAIIPDFLDGGKEGLLSSEKIAEELEYLKGIYDEAVKNALSDGSDLTELLTNPDFSTDNWTGWTKQAAGGGNVAVGSQCAEAWNNSSFDIYQEVADLPAGLYEISVQGFYRYGRGNNAYQLYNAAEEEKVEFVKKGGAPVFVYLNNMTTPFVNVFDEPKEEGFYSTNSWHYDGNTEELKDGKYYPDGMVSAAVAFGAGMYTQKAYGLVKEGEKMRIGVKGSSNQLGDSWCIFDNFKLTFRGKDATAAGEVLKMKMDELSKLLEVNADNMTDPVVTAASNALKKAKNILDASMNYETLIEINDALVAAQENVTVVEAYKTIQKKYDDACSELELSDPDAEEAIWDDIDNMDNESGINDGDDAFKDFTTAELTDLSSRMEQLTEAINAVMDAIKAQPMLEDLAGATDEAPKDVTKYMVNPDFETGNLDGWTYYKGGDTKAAENSNGTYTINDERVGSYVFNTWDGSVPSEGFWVAQTVKCLPAGTYLLTAILASDANNVITLSANDASADFTMVGDKATAYDASLIFTIGGEQTSESPLRKVQATTNVEIKAKSNSWFKADNFQLTYYGTDSDVTPTAIDVIDAQPATAKNGKYMQDGQLIILKNGKKYNAMGVLLR